VKGKNPTVEEIAMTAVCRLLSYGLFVLAFAPLSVHASTARVYITNSAGDSIHVIDTTTNKVVQVIRGVEAAHGINLSFPRARTTSQ
jgi:YVTN family beta-propeller protein